MRRLPPTRYACRAVFPTITLAVILWGFLPQRWALPVVACLLMPLAGFCLLAEMKQREDELDEIDERIGGCKR